MPSQKVRKQLTFVNASRRRLKKMMIENGDQAPDSTGKSRDFSMMCEEFKQALDEIKKLRDECEKMRKKTDGEAARKRHEYNGEVRRAKEILKTMKESLSALQKKIEKVERKGGKKVDSEKHTQRKREFQAKDELITTLYTELEKLEWAPERMQMNKQEAGRLREADDVLRAARNERRKAQLMQDQDDAPEGGEPIDEHDPEYEANQKQIEANKKEQEAILGRISQGLGVLKERAIGIGEQVEQSNARLQEMEEKADETHSSLKQLNKATLKALDEASNSSYFTNLACFLLLLALAGVAVYYLDLV
eukprot:TRINITY_DN26793_c0_g1_i1.p1 TRINITY_DN26793_c0_g1~~TRINITY_DN26793_c0_g1_i1.p1  ORF type:complete len:320 (+),score=86.13 TRINITY_DN26793_c0_g1_i1:45-962(+)